MREGLKSVWAWLTKLLTPVFTSARYMFSHVPIFGPLVYCKLKDHGGAAKEMAVILSFATATFWLTSLFLLAAPSAKAAGYLTLLQSTVRSGELFIFTVGFLGPILLLTETKKDEREFPGRTWHLLALVLLGIVATGFHAMMKYAQSTGGVQGMNTDVLFTVSVYVAAASVLLRYLGIAYKKSTFVPQTEIKDREQGFADDYAKEGLHKSPQAVLGTDVRA